MKRCISYTRLLSFRESLLPEKEKHAVQTHLDRCEGWCRERDQFGNIAEVIEQNPDEELVQTPKPLLESGLAMIPFPGQR